MKKSIQIKGIKELIARLQKIRRESPKAIAAALYQEGQEIMSDSKENFVPVDFGVLKNSGHVELPQISGDKVTVTLGYGGAASGYAIYVHENLAARHKVGQAKYLEVPLLNASRTMARRLASRAAAWLQRQGKR